MFHIDKFFSKEVNVVIQPIDDEYTKYLENEMKANMELEQTINELDDYFLNATEPENNQNTQERD